VKALCGWVLFGLAVRMIGHKKIQLSALLLVSISLFSCGGSGSSSLSPILPPPKAAPDIFDSYYAHRNSNLANNWTRGMDMSGVSFDNSRTATLITPRHVVMAKHYARNAAAHVIFHDRKGKRVQRKLIGFYPGLGDVVVGLLDEPVPSNYTSYPLPTANTVGADLIGKFVIVTDQHRKLFVHQVASVSGGGIAFRHDPNQTHGWSKNLIFGDSGNPSFVISGSELVLIETHTTGGPGAGPYFGDPAVQQSIREAVKKLDPNFQIKTTLLR
jgi:hypothetical protein